MLAHIYIPRERERDMYITSQIHWQTAWTCRIPIELKTFPVSLTLCKEYDSKKEEEGGGEER